MRTKFPLIPQASVNIQAKQDALMPGEYAIDRTSIPEPPLAIIRKLSKAGHEAYLVGGCIRDLLLGLVPKDFDVATSATPRQITRVFGRSSRIIGRRFRIVHVYQGDDCVEVSTFRAAMADATVKSYKAGSGPTGRALREHNNRFGDLADDAIRRDFTINALYYNPVDDSLYDFTEGGKDIADRRLRLIGDVKVRYLEDPVRMLRAARFHAKLDFRLDHKSEAPIKELAPMLSEVPAARLCGEVGKLFLTGHAAASLESLKKLGLLGSMFPALARVKNDKDWLLLRRALQLIDSRIALSAQVAARFMYLVLLWPLLQDALRKTEAGDKRLNEQKFAAIVTDLLSRPDATISTTFRLREKLHEVFLMQHQLCLHRPESIRFSHAQYPLIAQLAEFLILRGKHKSDDSLVEQGTIWRRFAGKRSASVVRSDKNRRTRRRKTGNKWHKTRSKN